MQYVDYTGTVKSSDSKKLVITTDDGKKTYTFDVDAENTIRIDGGEAFKYNIEWDDLYEQEKMNQERFGPPRNTADRDPSLDDDGKPEDLGRLDDINDYE